MCNEVVQKIPWLLEYAPDWLVTQQQIKIWHDRLDNWSEGYQKRKAQKAKIKDQLMPIAWHPSRWWDWCVPEEERKKQKNYF